MAIVQTLESCKTWLRDKGLTVRLFCVDCRGHTCIWSRQNRSRGIDGSQLRCLGCRKDRSIRVGSFFFKIHLALKVLVSLFYCFAYKIPFHTVETQSGVTKASHRLVLVPARHLQSMASGKQVKLDGVGCIVEIDECMLEGKRKYNRGRILPASGCLVPVIGVLVREWG